MTVTNVDDILVPREQAMMANEQIPSQPAVTEAEPVSQAETEAAPEVEATPPDEYQEVAEVKEEPPKAPIDEYGNPVEKPRLYTEEELQQRIRERLSRGKHAEQVTPQQVQKIADNFTADPDSNEDWQTQLKTFVKETLKEVGEEASQRQWQEQEQARQADFESRFTAGMSKYQDFHQVVGKVPITNEVMLAARALDNPASFIYAAAKLHPQELERIARIPDPYAQSAEVGRLHERMVKAKRTTSQAAKPLEAPKGDVAQNSYTRPSIDSMIEAHAKQKRAR